jgi:hypothetical protein
VRILTSTG